MLRDEVDGATIEVDVSGEVDAAAAAVGAVVAYGAVGDGGRAFQEQTATAVDILSNGIVVFLDDAV